MISSPVWSTSDPAPTTATYSCVCGFSAECDSWEDAMSAQISHSFANCTPTPLPSALTEKPLQLEMDLSA